MSIAALFLDLGHQAPLHGRPDHAQTLPQQLYLPQLLCKTIHRPKYISQTASHYFYYKNLAVYPSRKSSIILCNHILQDSTYLR
jgi:hypothetical protein